MPKAGYKPGPRGWKLKVEIYEGWHKRGSSVGFRYGWYWHAIAKNGRIVADSGQGYTRRNACKLAFYRIERWIRNGCKEIEHSKKTTVIYY